MKAVNGDWIAVPLEQCVLWAGAAATEISNGKIPAGIHRVVGSDSSRMTIWYEVCTLEQIPEDIWKLNNKNIAAANVLDEPITVTVKFLTGRCTIYECTLMTTVEALK